MKKIIAVSTVVTYEMTGRYNIQRFPGLFTSTIFGAGLGDLDFDGAFTAADLTLFRQVLGSDNRQFNPAADLNGDGLIDSSDLLRLWPRLLDVGAGEATLRAYYGILGPPADGYFLMVGQDLTLTLMLPPASTPPLTFDWDLDLDGVFGDVRGAGVTVPWTELGRFGITGAGVYYVVIRVGDGVNATDLWTTLFVVEGDRAPG